MSMTRKQKFVWFLIGTVILTLITTACFSIGLMLKEVGFVGVFVISVLWLLWAFHAYRIFCEAVEDGAGIGPSPQTRRH